MRKQKDAANEAKNLKQITLIISSIAAVCAAAVLLVYQIFKNWLTALIVGAAIILAVGIVFLIRYLQKKRKPPLPEITMDDFRTVMLPVFAPSLRLVSVNTSSQIEALINNPRFTIGRDEECCFRIKDDAVSRLHCTIVCDVNDGHYEIHDDHSANGTGLNGRQLESDESAEIAVDDMIMIEKYKFKVCSAYV